MYRLRVKDHFDAAHYIRDYPGKCSREHGHRWTVEVIVEGGELDGRNILVDFALVKKFLSPLVGMVDHYQLNEQFGGEPNMTAEYMAKWFHDCLEPLFVNQKGIKLTLVTVWESPECCVSYDGG